MTISRRDALTGLGGTLALWGIPLARAADLSLVHVGLLPIFTVAPHFAADRLGFFAAEGIATTTQPVQGGAIGIPGLVSGSFDVLYTDCVALLTALDRGIDLRLIAEATIIGPTPPDVTTLLKRKSDNFRTGKDLEGKSVAITARYNLMWLVVQAWAKKTGGDPDKIVYREVPAPSMLDALGNGQVDAALLVDPFMTIGLGNPNFDVLAWPSSMVMAGLPSSFWITSGTAAETKADLIHAYVRGLRKGIDWYNAKIGTPEFLDLVSSYTHTDVKLLAKMYTPKQPTEFQVDALRRLVTLVQDEGLVKTNIDLPSKIFRT